jgi:RimJ/RimL family protein N-acetyltransferase
MRVRRAVASDVDFIIATENLASHRRFIGQWSVERHLDLMQSKASRYVLAENEDGAALGFAILMELDNRHGNVLLQRLAVAVPERGVGRWLLARVVELVFAETLAHRLHLNVFADNDRAIHVYQTSGFTQEARLREARLRADGSRCDSLIFSMLRHEWPRAASSATT